MTTNFLPQLLTSSPLQWGLPGGARTANALASKTMANVAEATDALPDLDELLHWSSRLTHAAVAAGMSWAAIGTETDGSITCPASINGIVGLKPTIGLVSRNHIVPISHSQDTAGPMTTSVADAALLLTAMAGSDPADPATVSADQHKQDFARGP